MSDIRDFGARGDGTTDDTAAIQHALDRANGVLQFPRGNYRISRTMEIRLAQHGRIALNGQGGVGRVLMTGPGPAFRFVGTHTRTAEPAGFTPQVWDKERLPLIEGLEIVGGHPAADG